MAFRNVLILRKPRSGCLEGRTAPIQPIVIGPNVSSACLFQIPPSHARSSSLGGGVPPSERPSTSGGGQLAVIVTMVAVRVVKVVADAVVYVVTVRNRLMAAARAVDMARLVPAAAMVRRAVVGVLA
jgi:hypothetical protein